MVKLKLNLFSTLEYLVSFFIILECRSVYYLSIGNSKKIIIVMLLVSVSILCFFTVLRPDFHVDLKETIFLSFWNLYMFVYIVVSGGEIKQVILRYCLFFSLMYVYFYYWKIEHSKDFLKRYSNIVTIIAIISLVFWFFGSLLNYLEPSGIVNIYWGKDIVVSNYHYVYFQWQNDAVLFGKTFYRNIGIFSEAPMYVIHLSIAFMSSLFSKERNTFKLCVLFITMITTFSTAGIIIILLMIILKRAKKSIKIFCGQEGKNLDFFDATNASDSYFYCQRISFEQAGD